MHVRKQMPFTASRILSDQRLRRMQGSRLQEVMIQKHIGHWLPQAFSSTIADTIYQARQKEAVDASVQVQAHPPTPTAAMEETMLFISFHLAPNPKAAHFVVKRCLRCFRVFSKRA